MTLLKEDQVALLKQEVRAKTNVSQSIKHIREMVAKLPPHLQGFYQQLLQPTEEVSDFYLQLKKIVDESAYYFDREPPTYFIEHWKKRKSEWESLHTALQVAAITHEDLPLLILCRGIVSGRRGNVVLSFMSWSSLPSKLKSFLQKSMRDSSLGIHFFPNMDEETLEKKYLELIVAYQALAEEKLDLQLLVDENEDYQGLQQRIDQYLHLIGMKDKLNETLQATADKLTGQLAKKNKQLTDLQRQCEQLNGKLVTQSQTLDDAVLNEKLLRDENTLLKLKLARMTEESNAKTAELGTLRAQVEALVSEKSELTNALSMVHTKKLTQSRSLNDLKRSVKVVKDEVALQIAKFKEASSNNLKTIGSLDNLLALVNNLDRQVSEVRATSPQQFF